MSKSPAPGRGRRSGTRKAADQVQAQQQRLRRRLVAIIGIAVIGLTVLAGGVWLWDATRGAVAEREANQPGQSVVDLGNEHLQPGLLAANPYNSDPPTSGPHDGGLASWGSHEQPIAKELQIHNLEDGGVLVQYRCAEACPELVAQLTTAAEPYLSDPQGHVILAPYPAMGSRIALTAWGRIDTFDEFDDARIRQFIQAYRCIDWHDRPGKGRNRIPGCRPG